MARIHHPDRVCDTKKAAATEKFNKLYQAYSILIDPDTKNLYDAGGAHSHSLFCKPTIAAKWERYIRTIDSTDIDAARNNYQGSDTERRDIFRKFYAIRRRKSNNRNNQKRNRKGRNTKNYDSKNALFEIKRHKK